MGCISIPTWHKYDSAVIYPVGHRGPGEGKGREIHIGMTKEEVVSLVGSPQKSYFQRKNEEILIYPYVGGKFTLTFIENKLKEISEFYWDFYS